MQKVQIIVGTEMGGTEEVANYIAEQLQKQYQVEINLRPKASDLTRDEKEFLLFMTANTGAGDLPANITPLYDALQNEAPDIASRNYALVNFGDSSYPTFAEAGNLLDEAIMKTGANPITEALVIDANENRYPQKAVLEWLTEGISNL